ncbi:hypothetical protein SISSUDRAFT_1035398 [Sistotremastrum suecicum HHB10207 ss-3]|uniref:Uncharacterized protein n=1 Tax=Sistotremastrum suecicum HHB10207 ss-3 TaxID=1314776 RepID=A0A166AT01_9AGAM|nr:hypothetical protein SISSUDRAFT_1035398 [Sistotremastrum suecicum HHB10207 ss-3]
MPDDHAMGRVPLFSNQALIESTIEEPGIRLEGRTRSEWSPATECMNFVREDRRMAGECEARNDEIENDEGKWIEPDEKESGIATVAAVMTGVILEIGTSVLAASCESVGGWNSAPIRNEVEVFVMKEWQL